MLSSQGVRAYGVAALSAVVLTLAFPKVNAWILAPLGAAGLFWTWKDASWKRSFGLGWFAGVIYFSIQCWWWSTTIVEDVGVLAYIAVIVAAMFEALFWGLAAVMARVAVKRSPQALAPLATAAAFAATEWLRSIGVTGNPFAQLGYSQADAPTRVFAAFIGTNGLTFVLCALGAYLAYAIDRRQVRIAAIVWIAVLAALPVAWLAWPARGAPAPYVRVAAVQGNIAQTLKWKPDAVQEAITRYEAMTLAARSTHPQLVVWPETVIPVWGLNLSPALLSQFSSLARATDATILVGSVSHRGSANYNSLFIFTPAGLTATYDKRQLVPFAEHFPGKSVLFWLPYIGQLNGNYAEGVISGVYSTTSGLSVAPLICWESAFADLAYEQLAHGAQLLVISTDDAWFGTSSGPYQHAQIAQMRAVEAGAYVVRAAATGVSGIIRPDGTWQARAALETRQTVDGLVGPPTGSPFMHYGPTPVFIAILALYVAIVAVRRRA